MNNTSRTITFILLSSIIMMVAITLQNRFFPPKIPVKNDVVQNDADGVPENGELPAAKDSDSEPADKQEPAADPNNKEKQDADPSQSDGNDSEKKPDEKTAEKPGEAETGADADTAPQVPPADDPKIEADNSPKTAAEPDHPSVFPTLGSVAADSDSRFLYTFNSQGGSLRRIESTSRKKNGRFIYRDLETSGSYIGELDCLDTPDRFCKVRVVGPGTPADIAGLKPNDLILSVAGTPVVSADDLTTILANNRLGTTLEFVVQRGTTQLNLSVTTTEKPLEFIRPERSITTDAVLPEAFLLALHQTTASDDWKLIDNKGQFESNLKLKNWKLTETTRNGNKVIEFSYEISKAILEEVGLTGPLTVIKRYWQEPVSAEDMANLNSRSWDLNFEIEIQNHADSEVTLGYQLDGPTGLPTEGWWYQMKINGSGSFVGLAGARDVVGETNSGNFTFLGGPGLVTNMKKDPLRQTTPWVFEQYESDETRSVKFIGGDTQYFHVALLPVASEEEPFIVESGIAWPLDTEFPQKAKLNRLVDCTGVLFKQITVEPNGKYVQRFEIFSGPKEAQLLETYGLENNRAFGWFGSFSKALLWLLHLLYSLTFKFSYAIPVILLTMIVRSLMIPISRKAALNAQMMQYLSPQMKEIKKKYPEDMQKQAQAQKELFRRHKYNPLSGCLMGFVQLPIFIGLYRGLSVDIALRDQPLFPGLNWCTNLAAPDQLMRWDSWMPAFLASETGWLGPYLNILPLVTIVLFVTNAKLFTPPPTDEQQAMMQKMMTYMMFFMGFLFFKVPAALCLYFITSSIWGIAERKLLPKPKLDTDSLEGDDPESGGATATPTTEEFSNEKEVERRKQRDRDRKKKLRDRE